MADHNIVDSQALDIFSAVMLVLGISCLALPVAFVIYIIYKLLDNK
jgi:hypothetical protein